MTTTAVQPIEKFCSEKLIMCEYVNDLGYCRLTACVRQLMPMTTNEAINFLKKSKWTLAPHALGEAKWNEAVDMAVEALSAEAVQGEWIEKGEYAECSICGAHSGTQFDGVEPIPLKTKFCPNCGVKMEVKE